LEDEQKSQDKLVEKKPIIAEYGGDNQHIGTYEKDAENEKE